MTARPRDLVRIAAIAAVIYAGLLAIWIVAGAGYTIALAEICDLLFGGPFGHRGWVVVDADLSGGARRLEFVLSNTAREVSTSVHARARFLGWRPMALVAGLVLATPFPWRRRLEALAIGALLIHVPVLLRVLLRIATELAAPGGVEALDLTPGSMNTLAFLDSVVGTGLANKLIEPVLVWAIVAYRPGAWSGDAWRRWTDHAEPAGGP